MRASALVGRQDARERALRRRALLRMRLQPGVDHGSRRRFRRCARTGDDLLGDRAVWPMDADRPLAALDPHPDRISYASMIHIVHVLPRPGLGGRVAWF